MMRSLSSAVAGLRTHQTKMDVIGNNIANVNTYGFKSSRTTFADVYYQNLTGATRASGAGAGTNPTQIGYGSLVASVDVLNEASSPTATDRPMDVYITGDGFLVTKNAQGQFLYTRLGNLGFDEAGNLCDTNGNYVMGFPLNADGTPNVPASGREEDASALKQINVDPDLLDKLTGIQITAGGQIVGILPGNAKVELGSANLEDIFDKDSLNVPEDSDIYGAIKMSARGEYTATDIHANLSDMKYFEDFCLSGDLTVEAKDGIISVSGEYINSSGNPVKFTATAKPQGTGSAENLEFKFGGKTIFTATYTGTAPADETAHVESPTKYMYKASYKDKGENVHKIPDTDDPDVWEDFSGTNLAFGDVTVKLKTTTLTQGFNGTAFNVGTEPSEKIDIGCIALAKFANAAGMNQEGNSTFSESMNSGAPIFAKPGLEGFGALKAGYLEMSNVDISKEFSDMITTQRGFQANTRIVTVSDEMLQELVNLKR